LIGTWQAKEANMTIVLTLSADGTGKLDEAKIKYTIKGNTLSVEEGGAVNHYTFTLKDNHLTLAGGDLTQPMTFERQGASSATGLGARRNQAAASEATAAANTLPVGPVGTWEVKT